MDETKAWLIIGALAFAVTTLAGFIAKLYRDLTKTRAKLAASQEARIRMAEEHHREISALKDTIRRRVNGGE